MESRSWLPRRAAYREHASAVWFAPREHPPPAEHRALKSSLFSSFGRLGFLGGRCRRLKIEGHGARVRNEICPSHALHIIRGDFVDVVDRGKKFSPIAKGHVVGRQKLG